jgi:hypothetical protein
MEAAVCYQAVEARQQMFSGGIDESKTRDLDAAKDHSGKKCTAAVRIMAAFVSNRAWVSQGASPENGIRRSFNVLPRLRDTLHEKLMKGSAP